MNKLVVLSLGTGDLNNGFPSVTTQLWEAGNPHPMKFTGSLPAAPTLPQLYRDWQLLYFALYQRLKPRIEIDAANITNVSDADFGELCQRLSNTINAWLNSEQFRNIDQHLRTNLESSQEIRLIIETNDNLLRRLPWHLWNFFKHYPFAEVALSASQYQRPKKILTKKNQTVRILGIFGNSRGIDIGQDQFFLEQLSQAKIKFLIEPQIAELNAQLWEKAGWDMLFFAGHSHSQEQGIIQLNQRDSLTLEQLKYGLQKAIARGLKLAIFNSCDGLGLAQDLANLNIAQVIVMREPVPDLVAQAFLKHFLLSFAEGQSLSAAVREAREKLQGLEPNFPCASWLPVICQNPAEAPTSWQELCGAVQTDITKQHKRKSRALHLKTLLFFSLLITGLIMGVRHSGRLQTWELQAFDHLMQQRSPEPTQDQRLLLITIDEADIQYQDRMQMKRQGSLSDQAFAQVLEKLEPDQPRVIGLDIYRDFAVEPAYTKLISRLKQDNRLFAVCKMSAIEDGDAEGVQPPPEVPKQRLGFSDFVVDSDSILRRQLLAMTPTSACATHYALNIQLALHYLQAEGISFQFTKAGELQLGKVVLKRLQAHTGGYQGVDASGYQMLLNYRYRYYRSLEDIAPQVSLTQVLTGAIAPNLIKDRLVLIGVITKQSSDYWSTPYSARQPPHEQISGVVAQAQMISQILSAVLDQRPLLWVWSQWGELVWVWGWSVLGGAIAWRCYSWLYLGLWLGMALTSLYAICFVLFTQGGWVPLVPCVIVLLATSGSVVVYLKQI